MKKFYLQAILMVLAAFSSQGQIAQKHVNKNNSDGAPNQKLGHLNLHHGSANNPNTASVIWADDFSTPSNWTITNDVGNTDDWVIGTNPPSGPFAILPIASTTAANNFALFDSDLMCSGDQIGNLTNTTPINCSGHANVRVKFEQYYRRYIDSTYLYVSNNGGTSWTLFPINPLLALNAFTPSNPDLQSIDISTVAGNQAAVLIRFTLYSPASLGTGAGCAYAWMIDDVSLEDVPSDDIGMVTSFPSQYTMIPLSQTQSIDLSAQIINSGPNPETNVGFNANVYLIQNGVPALVFNGPSNTAATLAAGATTAALTAGTFTPSDTGVYAFEYIAFMTNTDADNSNDTLLNFIVVNDTTYARDQAALTGLFDNALGFNANTGTLGQIYDVYNNRLVTSASFYLSAPTLGDNVTASIYSVTAGVPDALLGTTASYTITASDVTGVFLTLSFSPPIAVTSGQFYTGIDQINMNNITLAFCNNIFTPGTVYYEVTGGAWTLIEPAFLGSFLLRPNLDVVTGIAENKTSDKNIDLFPNPSDGKVYIRNNNLKADDYTFTLTDQLGNIVYSGIYNQLVNAMIDLNKFSNGVYTIQLKSNSEVITKSIVLSGK